jgi:hypothetical protein
LAQVIASSLKRLIPEHGAPIAVAALRRLAATWSYPRDRLRLGIAPTIPHHCTREFMATEGSARVLGMGDFLGKIAKGYKADVVLLDLDHVNFVPLNNATNQIVFTENGGAVDKVLIGGKLVVAGGRAIGIDRAALAAKAQAAVERLAALNADARRFAERIEPIVSNVCRGLADDDMMHGCAATSAGPTPAAFIAANHHAGRACRTTRKSLGTDSPVQPGWGDGAEGSPP